ncbi:MAG: lysophospholipase [Spirochaetes bacterium]|nr:lysophospholipase [Spirochaetota bacterium]
MSVKFTTKFLRKKDGTQIFFRFWQGKSDMPVMILLHGLGAHSLRFEKIANYYNKKKYNIYAFDFTGFGKSHKFKGHIESFNTYVNETLAMVKLSKIEFPKNSRFIVGEDIGGVVGLHFASHYQELITGLILLSPAARIRHNIQFQKMINALINTFFNKFYQYDLPFTKEMLTRDFKMQKELQHDELDVKTVTAKFYFAMLEAMKKLNRAALNVTLPVFLLQAENDLLIDVNSVKDLFNNLNSGSKELCVLKNFYHSLSIDKDHELVFQLIDNWINKILFLNDKI